MGKSSTGHPVYYYILTRGLLSTTHAITLLSSADFLRASLFNIFINVLLRFFFLLAYCLALYIILSFSSIRCGNTPISYCSIIQFSSEDVNNKKFKSKKKNQKARFLRFRWFSFYARRVFSFEINTYAKFARSSAQRLIYRITFTVFPSASQNEAAKTRFHEYFFVPPMTIAHAYTLACRL